VPYSSDINCLFTVGGIARPYGAARASVGSSKRGKREECRSASTPTDTANNSNAGPASRNAGGRPVTYLLAEINPITIPSARVATETLATITLTVTITGAGRLRDDLATTHTIC
jgi:hypothetical protein